ncbi:MAG: hypothetical protein ILNGONEN_02515 [Syntrophorhabdaceae bacterium]|nr:hypothetical protein [Syntrophorhabdaceae bacterium]
MRKFVSTDNLKATAPLVLGLLIFIAALFLIGFYFATPIYAGSYSRSATVSYADKWAHSRNSYYNNYANDCANFASQVMWAGGLPRIPSCDAPACQTDSVSNVYQWWYAPTTKVNSKLGLRLIG